MSDSYKWLKTRHKLLGQIKAQVSELLGYDPVDLVDYTRAFHKEFDVSLWTPCKTQEILTSMIQTQLVLGADFHAYSQSQRSHLRLLRSLPPGLKVSLALECFDSEDQPSVDSFMKGDLSEKQFLKQVDWNKKWGFPWESYRTLLHLAQQRGFRVFGLNRSFDERTSATLQLRDDHSAKVIHSIRKMFPEDIIYCLYGDLHLAEDHLPSSVRRQFSAPNLNLTIIHQDHEDLYFHLAHQGLEAKVEVMKSAEDKFCIIGSPPWVKWQSYLIYLEHTFDQDLEDDDDEGDFDFTDHLHALVQILVADFKFDVNTSDIAVYTASDDVPVSEENVDPKKVELLTAMIAHEQNFYFVDNSVLYLSRFSTNHAASLAGMFVHFHLMQLTSLPLNFPLDFTRYIWIEAISFFFSKWINHKRKADSLRELRARYASGEFVEGPMKEPMLLALDQRMVEMLQIVQSKPRQLKVQPVNRYSYLEAARILGSSLGEKIYSHLKANKMSIDELCELIRYPVNCPNFQKFYLLQIQRFESVGTAEVRV